MRPDHQARSGSRPIRRVSRRLSPAHIRLGRKQKPRTYDVHQERQQVRLHRWRGPACLFDNKTQSRDCHGRRRKNLDDQRSEAPCETWSNCTRCVGEVELLLQGTQVDTGLSASTSSRNLSRAGRLGGAGGSTTFLYLESYRVQQMAKNRDLSDEDKRWWKHQRDVRSVPGSPFGDRAEGCNTSPICLETQSGEGVLQLKRIIRDSFPKEYRGRVVNSVQKQRSTIKNAQARDAGRGQLRTHSRSPRSRVRLV